MTVAEAQELLGRIRGEVTKVIVGQEEVVEMALVAILAGQHALVEGVPGVGKTLLVRTLAKVLGGKFSRIQFTPDLMPADITGTNVFNMKQNEFTLVPGPVFTTFLLADEINRAPAKTQAALLQAMQERTVTIDRRTYVLPPEFTVFATQNPIEFEGTYQLPEAQKDRFMIKIAMGGPDREEELDLARRMLGDAPPEELLAGDGVQAVLGPGQLPLLQKSLRGVLVKDDLVGYLVDLVRATRGYQSVLLGGGPRATQALLLASRALAAVAGRDFVTPDDVKRMAVPVLEHRLILRPDYEIEGVTPVEVIGAILQEIAVPR
jgi:MoxR-like ATPase